MLFFTSKLIDGRFPDYEAVIPIGADKEVRIERESLRGALQRAAILSNEKYRGVKLEVSQNKLRIVAHNPEQEEAVEELEAKSGPTELSVGFNVNYLLDAINALQGDENPDMSSRCQFQLLAENAWKREFAARHHAAASLTTRAFTPSKRLLPHAY